ncbi:MAG: tetratricopeptide repeat protein [Acidobacteriota bacterium]
MIAPLLFCLALQTPAEDGIKALDSGKPAEAEALFLKALAADPNDFSLHFNLAFAQSQLNKDNEAIASYRKVLTLKPGLYEAQLNLGILLLRQKLYADAAPVLSAAAATKPNEYRPNYYLGDALLNLNRGAESEKAFRKALEINPKSAEAAQGVGMALLNQGKTAAGAPFIEQAVQLDPSFEQALLHLATVHEADKNFDAAIALYRRFPNDPAARERLGDLLLKSGKAASAIPELEAAAKSSPTVANYTALATAYLQAGQPGKCQAPIDAALRLEPNNGELRLLYGRLLREMRQFDLAANQFALAVKLSPNSPEAWSDLATATVLMERYDVALTALERLRQLNAEKPGHLYLRAITLDKVKQNRQGARAALTAYQDFLNVAGGKFPDEEFKARQRLKILEREVNR